MKLNYVILAQGVSLDQRTNIMSIIQVIEGFRTTEFPIRFEHIVLVVSLRREKNDPSKGNFELHIIAPKIKIKQELVFNFDSRVKNPPDYIKEELSHKLFLNIPRMEIKKPGEIRFIIKYKNKSIGSYAMSVELAKTAN